MEDQFYEMYLEELAHVRPFGENEKERLLQAAAAGDREAGKRLVEGSLTAALAIAKEYEGKELSRSDLVQEANTALMMAAAVYDGSEDWDSLSESRIRQAIEEALQEQKAELEIEEMTTAKVNVLQTVSQVMAKELGREATVAELAEKMKMTEEEILSIMKTALNALTLNGEGQAAGEDA